MRTRGLAARLATSASPCVPAARFAALGALAALCALAAAPPAGAAALTWRLAQPAPPAGAPFKVPLGAPGDLVFYAPNRGLLGVEGNAVAPRGIYAWNGRTWHELATVCGGPGDTMRIAFAGPDEFWTVSEPSLPRVGDGTALCHFVNGRVVGSYSTAPESPDPYHPMDAAACAGPADCWFGGYGDQDPTGERAGAFHLHWDGRDLSTVYAPQGRGVSAIVQHAGAFLETTFAGRAPEDTGDPVDLAAPEDSPALIHRLSPSGVFANDPWRPEPQPGVPADGSELLAIGAAPGAGGEVWAVGAGAASGPAAPDGGMVARPPLAARLQGGAFASVPLPSAAFGAADRLVSVAPVGGGAWVAVQRFSDRRSTNAKATVALLRDAGTVTSTRLPVSGSGRGAAARVAFPAAGDGWLVTTAGWLFHYTDGSLPPANTDPAWQGTTSDRPNEAQAQAVPDVPPPDDSRLFAPPPPPVAPANPEQSKPKRLPPVLRHVRRRLHGTTLVLTFRLVRPARIALIARRGGHVVARTRLRRLRPGTRTLTLRLDPRHWPTSLRFHIVEPGQHKSGTGGGGPIVTEFATWAARG